MGLWKLCVRFDLVRAGENLVLDICYVVGWIVPDVSKKKNFALIVSGQPVKEGLFVDCFTFECESSNFLRNAETTQIKAQRHSPQDTNLRESSTRWKRSYGCEFSKCSAEFLTGISIVFGRLTVSIIYQPKYDTKY